MKKDVIKICLSSLGCAKNLVDSEVMLASAVKAGVLICPSLDEADIYVINTCSFIDEARKESNEAIEEGINWKSKKRSRKLVVAGCLTQRNPDVLKKNYPEIDLFLSLDEIANLGKLINNLLNKMTSLNKVDKYDLPTYLYDENTPRLLVTPKHYAYIKISEGCNHSCGFCAIPTFRGKLRSRTITSIVKEATALLNNGVRELILVSQDSTAYGQDLNDDSNTMKLLQALDNLPCEEYWVRLLYLYPTTVKDDLITSFASFKSVLPYIDMPLQHASNKILKSMRRGITNERTVSLLDKFRNKIPNLTLRTTLLVGYPNEDEQDFASLKNFVVEQQFDRLGVFTYSHEEDTYAFDKMEDNVSKELAKTRQEELMSLQRTISLSKNKAKIGSKVRVIIDDVIEDEQGNRICLARSKQDAPEVDNQIIFAYDEKLGDDLFATVEIIDANEYDLQALIMHDN